MNKKSIASLLTVSIVAGTVGQVPVKLIASTVPASHQSMRINGIDQEILENKEIVASVFLQINNPQYVSYEKLFKKQVLKAMKIMEGSTIVVP